MIHTLLILLLCRVATALHFNGGTINWKAADPYSNSSIVPITITQSYAWTASITNCTKDVPITSPTRSGQNTNLTCVADCSTDGGYSLDPVDILTDCQTIISLVNVMTSQRSVSINLTTDAHFYISNVGGNWLAVNYPPMSNLPWSMVCSIDLRLRPDGFINTPPVATVISPQFAVINQTTLITIPVSDANAGDDIRCRWALDTTASGRRKRSDDDEEEEECEGCKSTCQFNSACCCPACAQTTCIGSRCSSTSGCSVTTSALGFPGTIRSKAANINSPALNECGGICYPGSVPNATTLSGCTISFLGLVPNTWYGVALQVEDFINNTSMTPMSSTPVQFLVYIMSPPTCGLAPVIFPLQLCLDVQVGISITFNISAMTLCDPNVSNIDTIRVTSSIPGMNMSNITNSVTNVSVSYATFMWTPQANQLGPQQLCVIAYSQEKLQSQQYCVTFNVMILSDLCVTTTTTTTSTSATSTLSVSETTTSTSTTSTSSVSVTTTTAAATITDRTTTTATSIINSTTTISETVSTTIITTSAQTTVTGFTMSVLSIAILITLGVLLLLCCCCCCLYWLCWSSVEESERQSEAEEILEQGTSAISNAAHTTQRTRFWIPIFSIGVPRRNYILMNILSPSKLSRAVPDPRSPRFEDITTHSRGNSGYQRP